MERPSPLLEILRSTLEEVKRDPELPPDNPRVIEIRQSIERSIAELEGKRLKRAA